VPKSSGAHAPPCRAARRKPRRIKSFYVYHTGSPRIVNASPASKPFMRAPARKRARSDCAREQSAAARFSGRGRIGIGSMYVSHAGGPCQLGRARGRISPERERRSDIDCGCWSPTAPDFDLFEKRSHLRCRQISNGAPLTLRREIMCCRNYIECFNGRLRYECLNVN
jgi:hypothetical protein